jgi:hypothetical protein
MNTEERSALVLGALSALLLIPSVRFPVLELVSNSVVAAIGGVLIAYTLFTKHYLIATVMIAVALYLFNEQKVYVSSSQQQMYLDTQADDARFIPSNSIDLQVANKTMVRASPDMLDPPTAPPDLLTYPPSAETLRELSG